MRIAIPYEEGNVFQHFGKSKQFKLYTIEDGKIVSSEVIDAGDTGHEALAGLLAELDVRAVICGGLGQGMMNALSSAGIDVYPGISGDADEAAISFLLGKLQPGEANCDHHHEKAGEPDSGSCGNHEEGCCGSKSPDGSSESAEGCCGGNQEDGEGCCGSDEGCGGGCGGCGGGAAVTWKSSWMERMPERRFMSITGGPLMTGHSSTPRTIAASRSPLSAGPA